MPALPPSGPARRTAITQIIGFIAAPVVVIFTLLVIIFWK
jgi:hypothetical protein